MLSMNRKSVEANQNQIIHTMQFSSFKRKHQQPIQISIQNVQYNQFRIRKSSNTLLIIMVIAELISTAKSKTKTNGRIFKDFILQNVPKAFYNYQHESTLQQLWGLLANRINNLSIAQELLTNYFIVEFVLICYARKTIKEFIENWTPTQKPLELHGNQMQTLLDYNTQIRGKLLQILALSLKLDVTVLYKDLASQLQDGFKEHFGSETSSSKIQIFDLGQFYKVLITFHGQAKLNSINSWQNIMYSNRKKEKQSLDTTFEGKSSKQSQSKSATKDIKRCVKCSVKGKVCQCDKLQRKVSALNPTSNSNKVGIQNTGQLSQPYQPSVFRRQPSNQQIPIQRH